MSHSSTKYEPLTKLSVQNPALSGINQKTSITKNSNEHCPTCTPSAFNTVIVGSFRKHLQKILQLRTELEKLQITVMSPPHDEVINPGEEFVIFQSDPTNDPKILQDCVFSKIRGSTFIIVANFDNYIGRAGTMEIGYAIAHGIGIYTIEPVVDPHLSPYCRLLSEIFPQINSLESFANLQGMKGGNT